MGEWEQVTNILKAEDIMKMLDWRSKLRRGSLTAVQASR